MKKLITRLQIVCTLLFFCACTPPRSLNIEIQGETMGTFYSIKYSDSLSRNFKPEIDSLLRVINNSMSTYIDSSLISKFNRLQDTDWFAVDEHFFKVTEISKIVFEKTGGAFDPTVMPLVNAWGFGPNKGAIPDSAEVLKILAITGFSKIDFQKRGTGDTAVFYVKKDTSAVALDYSAVAKGHGVDEIAELLEQRGIQNFMIEIGGEVRAKGKNAKSKTWSIGIEKPVESGERALQAKIFLENRSLATSGNYRNFFVKDGKKFVHTINPKTGYPEINNTLSVSVISDECAVADAFATAFMVIGVDAALPLAQQQPQIEAFFVFSDKSGELQTAATTGWSDSVVIGR